jgi:Spy/CpxP family protein refolding chaperone
MKNRVLTFIIALALLVGAVVLAAAQNGPGGNNRQGQPQGAPPPPPPPPFGVPDIEHLTQALNLSDAQAAQLKSFLDTERTTIDALMKKMGDEHKQLEDATMNGQFDEAQVRSLAGQQAQTMVDLIVEQERVKAKIYSTLTPEQRVKAEELHKRGGPRGRRPGGPDGPPPPPSNN